MVFERVIRLDVLDRLLGGFVRALWSRLSPWIEDERARTGVPNLGEWFEWLVLQMQAHPEPSKSAGAARHYRDWRP
jgi:hypothetical protein